MPARRKPLDPRVRPVLAQKIGFIRADMGAALRATDCETAHRHYRNAMDGIYGDRAGWPGLAYWLGAKSGAVPKLLRRMRAVHAHVGPLCRWR